MHAGDIPYASPPLPKPPTLRQKLEVSLELLYTGGKLKTYVVPSPDTLELLGLGLLGPGAVPRAQRRPVIFDVPVVKGWKIGTKVTYNNAVPNADELLPGEQPADVEFEIVQKEHAYLAREGDDLIFIAYITVQQAAKGVNVTIPQLDGRQLKLCTKGQDVKSGDLRRISGEGMPIKHTERKGDMVVRFVVGAVDRQLSEFGLLEPVGKVVGSISQAVKDVDNVATRAADKIRGIFK